MEMKTIESNSLLTCEKLQEVVLVRLILTYISFLEEGLVYILATNTKHTMAGSMMLEGKGCGPVVVEAESSIELCPPPHPPPQKKEFKTSNGAFKGHELG